MRRSPIISAQRTSTCFRPVPGYDGWRWRGDIDGVPVRLEFLCDLPDHREREVIRPSGCTALAAANLRGTGYVARDFSREELTGALPDGTTITVSGRFAGLDGYLLSKCVAVRTRAATKDYYDLVYVLLHNRAGGPEGFAEQALQVDPQADGRALRADAVDAVQRFFDTISA